MSGRRKPRVKRKVAQVHVKVEEPDISEEENSFSSSVVTDIKQESDSSITVKEEAIDIPEDPLCIDSEAVLVSPSSCLVFLPKDPLLATAKCYRPPRKKKPKLEENVGSAVAGSSSQLGKVVLPLPLKEPIPSPSPDKSDASYPPIVLKALSAVSKELNQGKAGAATTTSTTAAKDLNCKICPYTTNRSNNLARHMHTMHSVLADSQECCSQTFITRYDHQEHNREFHASSKYPCHFPECQKAQVVFERRGLLKRHVIGVHQRQKPFKCEYCSYQSSHKSNLDRHCRTQHASYFVSPTLDNDACSIEIEMDPSSVIKFKLDDDTFNTRPKGKVKEEEEEEEFDEDEVSIKEEPLESEEDEPVYPEVMLNLKIKNEPPDGE